MKTATKKPVVKAAAKTPVKTKKVKSSASHERVQELIRLKAYELYVQRGCEHGNDADDWIIAEKIILEELGKS